MGNPERSLVTDSLLELPEVPGSVIAQNGFEVHTRGNVWRLWDKTIQMSGLNWSTFPDGSVKRGLQLYFHYFIGAYAIRSVYGTFQTIRRLLRDSNPVNLGELDIGWWNNIRQNARETNLSAQERLHPLRQWYVWMADLSLPGTDSEVALTISDWRIPVAKRGTAVTRRDLEHGPLSEDEFSVLTEALKRPQPATLEFIATSLCKDLGSNPENLARIEERDFRVFIDPENGKKRYVLAVPRIKKRLATREVKDRPISGASGAAIEKYLVETHSRLGGPDPDRPLLCRAEPRCPKGLNGLQSWYSTAIDVSRYVIAFGEQSVLTVSGAREDAFRLTARRLRYTLATRLAQMGHSAAEIAEVLDHSDEKTCQVYIDSDFATQSKRLAGTLDPELAPTVDLLLGRRAKFSDTAVYPQIPGKVIGGELIGSIGLCGSGGICRHLQGFSCYGCDYLHVFADGPHEKVLEGAYRVRKLYVEQEGATHADMGVIDKAILGMRAAVAIKAQSQTPP